MKSIVYAAAAVMLATVAANAAPGAATSPANAFASAKAPERGDRGAAAATYDRAPVSLNRDVDWNGPSAGGIERAPRSWSGNDNEG
ncbi:hypothetical protein [Methylopila sp. M107]|uniref:hypothetical protein n=1 Tax=Methylopila sp. M107 TaxID=1101190 RepID=UPI00036D9F70|nr:hypothetical protein [Methylopila sp. M107]